MTVSAAPGAFIFIGRSGCGKGTQAELLTARLRAAALPRPILYIETGAKFRRLAEREGLTYRLVEEALADGQRLPDWLAIWNWADSLVAEFSGRELLIFDGAPRGLLEAQTLDTAFKFYNYTAAVIYLNVSNEWAAARLQERHRADDRDAADIANRLRWFDEMVKPAVEWYRGQSDYHFLDVGGERPREVVAAEIQRLLNL